MSVLTILTPRHLRSSLQRFLEPGQRVRLPPHGPCFCAVCLCSCLGPGARCHVGPGRGLFHMPRLKQTISRRNFSIRVCAARGTRRALLAVLEDSLYARNGLGLVALGNTARAEGDVEGVDAALLRQATFEVHVSLRNMRNSRTRPVRISVMVEIEGIGIADMRHTNQTAPGAIRQPPTALSRCFVYPPPGILKPGVGLRACCVPGCRHVQHRKGDVMT